MTVTLNDADARFIGRILSIVASLTPDPKNVLALRDKFRPKTLKARALEDLQYEKQLCQQFQKRALAKGDKEAAAQWGIKVNIFRQEIENIHSGRKKPGGKTLALDSLGLLQIVDGPRRSDE